MKHIFIIVEGPSDEVILGEILNILLPADQFKLHFYPAGGYYNALTSVRPILDLVPDESKVLLVFDADTTNPNKVQERLDFVKDHVGYQSYNKNFDVFTFVPTIDVVIPQGVEYSKLKRISRSEYNTNIKGAIRKYIDDIRNNPTINDIINFVE